MTLYLLSLACAVAYGVSVVLGESWPLLGIAAFALMILAVISDRGPDRGNADASDTETMSSR